MSANQTISTLKFGSFDLVRSVKERETQINLSLTVLEAFSQVSTVDRVACIVPNIILSILSFKGMVF